MNPKLYVHYITIGCHGHCAIIWIFDLNKNFGYEDFKGRGVFETFMSYWFSRFEQLH